MNNHLQMPAALSPKVENPYALGSKLGGPQNHPDTRCRQENKMMPPPGPPSLFQVSLLAL
jgi:hypothetical protein